MKTKKFLSITIFIFLVLFFQNKVFAVNTLFWPVPGHCNLSQHLHINAIDISDYYIGGANVHAAWGGTVTNIFLCPEQHYGSSHTCYGFGTGLVILGDDGRYYQYAHMQAGSIPANVYYGARVERGQLIGKVGTTGNSSGYHLHFGISIGAYYNDSGIDPEYEVYANRYDTVAPTPVQNLGDNFYAYLNMAENGLYNADRNSSIILEKYSKDLNLIWKFVRQSDGSYTIMNVASGLYLDICGYNDYDGGVIQTYPYNGSIAQKYYIYGNQNGYILRAQCLQNRVVTVNNGGNVVGNKLNVWFYYPNCLTQLFKINKTSFPIKDVSESAWYYSAVKYAYTNKLMTGYENGKFGPSDSITRGQFITILYRLNGSPSVNYNITFRDVPNGAYYTNAVKWAVQRGITTGYNAYSFGPNDKITREQIAIFLTRYSKNILNKNTISSYNLTAYRDSNQIGTYAVDSMKYIIEKGVIKGDANGVTLRPKANSNRAEAATMIMRFCKNVLGMQ